MFYRDEGVRNGIAETGEEIGDGEHHEDPAQEEAPHVF